MGRVSCSEQVTEFLAGLAASVREEVELRFDYLTELPRMYPLSRGEAYPGCRTFWVPPCYRAYYMVAAGGDDVHVVALVEEDVHSMDAPDE